MQSLPQLLGKQIPVLPVCNQIHEYQTFFFQMREKQTLFFNYFYNFANHEILPPTWDLSWVLSNQSWNRMPIRWSSCTYLGDLMKRIMSVRSSSKGLDQISEQHRHKGQRNSIPCGTKRTQQHQDVICGVCESEQLVEGHSERALIFFLVLPTLSLVLLLLWRISGCFVLLQVARGSMILFAFGRHPKPTQWSS